MKNLKPSQLPEGTVIDDDKWGMFPKLDEGIWEEVYSGCCSPIGRLSDNGRPSAYGDKYGMNYTVKADDIFTDFKIISVPPGFQFDACALHGFDWDLDANTHIDGTPAHDCKGYNCEEP